MAGMSAVGGVNASSQMPSVHARMGGSERVLTLTGRRARVVRHAEAALAEDGPVARVHVERAIGVAARVERGLAGFAAGGDTAAGSGCTREGVRAGQLLGGRPVSGDDRIHAAEAGRHV